MLNKLLALLLSAGLLLSPIADSTTAYSSSELNANIPITVGKQQAVWEKYTDDTIYSPNVTKENENEEFSYIHYADQTVALGKRDWHVGIQFYPDYKLTATGIELTGVPRGIQITYTSDKDTIVKQKKWNYYMDESGKLKAAYFEAYTVHWSNGDSRHTNEWAYSYELIREKTPLRGSYISDVTADNGTLPQNGVHMDGYWYVFKKLVED